MAGGVGSRGPHVFAARAVRAHACSRAHAGVGSSGRRVQQRDAQRPRRERFRVERVRLVGRPAVGRRGRGPGPGRSGASACPSPGCVPSRISVCAPVNARARIVKPRSSWIASRKCATTRPWALRITPGIGASTCGPPTSTSSCPARITRTRTMCRWLRKKPMIAARVAFALPASTAARNARECST